MSESQQNDIPIILANSRCIRAFLGLLEIIHFKDQKKKATLLLISPCLPHHLSYHYFGWNNGLQNILFV